ncbi:biotin/lipoate--protein ligase family protein [Tritonibacter scottomollicae]|uniref:Biotin-(Acetyl-CoA carboxylase) ligase n=1 Tax=Tritonibacter scottomollicae TaxID=483013 RepID=A0A2T1AG73_TRISK|nr:biotin/lipoate--protein ligase family protein [Tritonibacter scottomollicae]PRZ47594.1 biotin-(acetyl-CoA carboxylase) ligase [Tritonibacter scottomollicae]
MSDEVTFPPLMTGEAAGPGQDPFDLARQKAELGVDAGLVVYDLGADTLRAALVLAPEVPLAQAMAMLPTCGVGFQNALGALAPPEVAVHLDWEGGLRVNGARCGSLRIAASTDDPAAQPDWLVVALELPLWPQGDGGETPDQTALYAEGCAEVTAPRLLESWTRHCLHWINRWDEGDLKALHAEWQGLAHDIGEDRQQAGLNGTFLGVDADFGMLLRDDTTTHLIPLTTVLVRD